jgi:hypothetical protein
MIFSQTRLEKRESHLEEAAEVGEMSGDINKGRPSTAHQKTPSSM